VHQQPDKNATAERFLRIAGMSDFAMPGYLKVQPPTGSSPTVCACPRHPRSPRPSPSNATGKTLALVAGQRLCSVT
jgi:hypothetical protein